MKSNHLKDILSSRFSNYARYIIQDRALPDAKDGLKPVQRRIIYVLYLLKLLPDKPYKKAARVVGEIIGKYHPHGDSSAYDALVYLSQNWKMRYPLVQIHGNNGSIDGDPPAAMRYTEVRLTANGQALYGKTSIQYNPFVDNFDATEKEPVLLTGVFPNLLANGSLGLAVGYATKIPSHNLAELINAILLLNKNPQASVQELLQVMPGPDFATGGLISYITSPSTIYKTGAGQFNIYAKTQIIKNKIIVTELPYGVNKSEIVKKIIQCALNNPDLLIKNVQDETSKQGIKISVILSHQADPNLIRNYLFSKNILKIMYNANIVAIVEGRPQQCGLHKLIQIYWKHQIENIKAQAGFHLTKNKKDLSITEGLLIVLKHIDEVIHIIKNSDNAQEASTKLKNKYSLTNVQVEAIIHIPLINLSKKHKQDLLAKVVTLEEKVAYWKRLLHNADFQNQLLCSQLQDLKAVLGDERKTKIAKKGVINEKAEAIIIKKPELNIDCFISNKGFLWIQKANLTKTHNYELQNKDYLVQVFNNISNHNKILCFTNTGIAIMIDLALLGLNHKKQPWHSINTFCKIALDNNKIVNCILLDNIDDVSQFKAFLVTQQGRAKIIAIKDLLTTKHSKNKLFMKLKANDYVVSCQFFSKMPSYLSLITVNGLWTNYQLKKINALSNLFSYQALGIRLIKLHPNNKVIHAHAYYASQNNQWLMMDDQTQFHLLQIDKLHNLYTLGSSFFTKKQLKAIKKPQITKALWINNHYYPWYAVSSEGYYNQYYNVNLKQLELMNSTYHDIYQLEVVLDQTFYLKTLSRTQSPKHISQAQQTKQKQTQDLNTLETEMNKLSQQLTLFNHKK